MGSPRVFHTAPPQPASNARMTCSPVLDGGADASQKGLGLLMPQMSTERSAMALVLSVRPAREQGARGVAAVGDGIDDLFAAVDAVAAAEDLGVAGLAGLEIGLDAAALVELDAGEELGDLAVLCLADRDAHDVARQIALGSGDRLAAARMQDAQGRHLALCVAHHRVRERAAYEDDAFLARPLHLVEVAAHLVGAATVDHRHLLGAELRALARDVDRGISTADDDHPPEVHLRVALLERLHPLDPLHRAVHARAAFADDAELRVLAEAEAEEHRVVAVQE